MGRPPSFDGYWKSGRPMKVPRTPEPRRPFPEELLAAYMVHFSDDPLTEAMQGELKLLFLQVVSLRIEAKNLREKSYRQKRAYRDLQRAHTELLRMRARKPRPRR